VGSAGFHAAGCCQLGLIVYCLLLLSLQACADGQCMSDALLWSTACQAAQVCFPQHACLLAVLQNCWPETRSLCKA
jgi:hypothetical protein